MSVANVCRFIGNLGKDPEIRYTPGGTMLAKFSLAVDTFRKDASGEYKKETTWVDMTAFGKMAERVQKICTKGTKIAVETTYQKRPYEFNGQKRTSHDFILNGLELLGGNRKEQSDEESGGFSGDGESGSYGGEGDFNSNNDELPF